LASSVPSRLLASFDRFVVDLSSGELLGGGIRVPIQEQPFQVLRLLLEAEGKVVTREQLRASLWPQDTFVDFEHGVNTAVKKLRHALQDSAEHPRFVETLPKFGYRFIIPVHWKADDDEVLPNNNSLSTKVAGEKQTGRTTSHWRQRFKVRIVALGIASAALVLLGIVYLSTARWASSLQQLHSGNRPTLSQRQLTANPNNLPLTSEVISPDGKYLAYTDPSGFYLRQIETGETHSVPLPKGFSAVPESWLPDSTHIVVSWSDSSEPPSLWVVSILGGTPRKLVDRAASARVSPDGSTIAYLSGTWDHEGIWLVQTDGSRPRKVIDGGDGFMGPVAWAPDGERFAYVRIVDHYGALVRDKGVNVYSISNGSKEEIFSDIRVGEHIAWPANDRLIYSMHEDEPNQRDYNLWSVALDPHSGRLSGSPTRITSNGSGATLMSIAVGGKRMALLRYVSQADVYVVDIEANGQQLGQPRRLTLDEREDFPASWTRDGKSVLFISDRDGPVHIFKQNTEETQPELLIGGKVSLGMPRITPDGLNVIYSEPSDSSRIMRAPLSGGPPQFVLEARGILDYQCSTLPSTICVYGQIERSSDYYKFFMFDPLTGKQSELLAARMKRENGPNAWGFSPDGQYLATFKSQNPYERPTLRILNLRDGGVRFIPVPQLGIVTGTDWAADSKSLWLAGYMRRNAWNSRSGIVNVDLKGNSRLLLDGGRLSIWFAIPSPDGRRLAFIGHTENSNVSLLENF